MARAPRNGSPGAVGGRDPSRPPRGGVVERDGLAVVHRGEVIRPAEGSQAEIAMADVDARTEITYSVPIVIEVGGQIDGDEREAIIAEALGRLRRAIENRAARE